MEGARLGWIDLGMSTGQTTSVSSIKKATIIPSHGTLEGKLKNRTLLRLRHRSYAIVICANCHLLLSLQALMAYVRFDFAKCDAL